MKRISNMIVRVEIFAEFAEPAQIFDILAIKIRKFNMALKPFQKLILIDFEQKVLVPAHLPLTASVLVEVDSLPKVRSFNCGGYALVHDTAK